LRDNPARPPFGAALCRLEDIPEGGARGFVFREGDALFAGFILRKGKTVTGFVDHCPHAGWPLAGLADQYLTRDGDFILCSGHGALFQKTDGLCVSGPCYGEHLEAWPVEVVRGVVRTR
jgi:nitrite reductase/ring-hydroxylating ferredoxin subunit